VEAVRPPRPPQDDPAKWPSLALSATVHLLLIGALFLGVQWKSKPPSAVEVEVWRAAPAPPVASPARASAGSRNPGRRAESGSRSRNRTGTEAGTQAGGEAGTKAPNRAIAKARTESRAQAADQAGHPAEGRQEAKGARRRRSPRSRKRHGRKSPKTREPVPKEEEPNRRSRPRKEERSRRRSQRPKAKSRKPEPERRPSFDDELKREQKQLQQQKAAGAARASRCRGAPAQAVAGRAGGSGAEAWAQAEYIDKVRGKIRGNITLPPGIQGNPQAEFEVTQLPTGRGARRQAAPFQRQSGARCRRRARDPQVVALAQACEPGSLRARSQDSVQAARRLGAGRHPADDCRSLT
jgi:colicin import membrane protein